MLSSLAAVAALVLVPAAAGAANRYASPAGTGTNPCDVATLAGACPIATAVNGAVPGDDITLLGGVPPSAPYAYSGAVSLDLPTGATVHGAPGARPVINFSSPATTDGFFIHDDTSTLRDVVLNSAAQSASPVDALAGRIERVTSHLSAATGESNYACVAGTHAVFLDTVCWYDGPDDPVNHNNSALAAFAQVPGDTVTLRNVTAYATNGTGLNSVSQLGRAMAVSATNVVAHGGFTDVKTSDFTPAGGPHGHTVAFDHSNYVATAELTPGDVSPAPGTGTNQTGPLAFAGAASGDFRETASSTGTLNLGTATGLLPGELDLDGGARVVGSAPDIGASEFVPPPPDAGDSGGTPGAPAGTAPANPKKKKCKKKKHKAAAAKKCKKKKKK